MGNGACLPVNITIASASFSVPRRIVYQPSGSFSVVSIMLTFLSSVCSSSFRGRLTKTLKGGSSFHISFMS